MNKSFFDAVNEAKNNYKETLDNDNQNQDDNEIRAAVEIFNMTKNMLPPKDDGLNIGDSCLFYEMGEIVECFILDRKIESDDCNKFTLYYKLKVVKAETSGLYSIGDEFEIRRVLGENNPFLNMINWSMMPIPK